MNEQCGNLYENKGSIFHRQRRSGNVIENKDSYALKTGNVIENTACWILANELCAGWRTHSCGIALFDSRLSTLDCLRRQVRWFRRWRFHLKRRRNRFPIPYSLLCRVHRKRWRCLSSTPTIPFGSRTPMSETFSPIAHSNWMIWYCDEAVLVM